MKKMLALCMVLALCGCSVAGQTGSSKEIKIYTRDVSSGTREAFEKAGDFKGQMTSEAIEVSGNGDMATKVGNDVNGIGYVSLFTDYEANHIVPLTFEGVKPSEETVLNGSYQMQRSFAFVTRAKGDYDSEEKEQLIAAFLDFMQNSTEGMMAVQRAGGVVDLSKSTPWKTLKEKYPIVDENNTGIVITTAGSTSVEKSVKAALESFQSRAGQFQFRMNQSGSGDGYKRVLGSEKDGANRADIGFTSRDFNDEEDVSAAMASGKFCIDAVVVVVHRDNTAVENLTQDQIKKIFSGAITCWEELK